MSPLPRSAPSAQGTDARGVVAFLDAIDGVDGIEPHSVMLLRHGHVIAQGWWSPYTPEGVQQLYSLSKSFTSTAAGMAWEEGLLDLDAPVISYFPELDAEVKDERSRSILIRHIASMSAGHTSERWDHVLATHRAEPVRGFLLDPPDEPPGSTFAYSQPTTYTLGAVLQRVTGQTLTEYLRPRLFEPLGIERAMWTQHPAGRDLAFAGLHSTTEAVARLGQLYLQGGVWEGRRLLSAEWVEQATRVQTANGGPDSGLSEPSSSDWAQGYGFQFWMSRHGYRGDGAFGQFCVVLPDQDAVLALTSETYNMQAVLDAAWTHLLPAFEGACDDAAAADAELEQRLTNRRLPFPDGAEAPSGEFKAGRSVLPKVVRISLTPQELTLHEEDGTETVLPLVAGSWPVRGHLAARAAQTDTNTVTVHLQFVQSPHKLRITCDLRTGTFKAAWRCVPLGEPGARLADLAQPPRVSTL